VKKAADDKAAKKAAMKGKNSIMNGRALFQYNPDLFVEADEPEKKEEQKVDSDLFQGDGEEEDEVDFD